MFRIKECSKINEAYFAALKEFGLDTSKEYEVIIPRHLYIKFINYIFEKLYNAKYNYFELKTNSSKLIDLTGFQLMEDFMELYNRHRVEFINPKQFIATPKADLNMDWHFSYFYRCN